MTQALQTLPKNNHLAAVANPDVNEFTVMRETAAMLVKTGFLPPAIKSAEQAMAIILTGRELGIPAMAALNTINVISGKPTISPQLMLALIERSGQLADIRIDVDAGGVTCTMKRKGRSQHTERFGDDEAKAMQLSGKDNYKKQAQTMYRWRAVAACARVVFPDVILGLYTPDEMGADVDEDGVIVEPAASLRPNGNGKKASATPAEITALCQKLNAKGDSIEWTNSSLLDYAQTLFNDETFTEIASLDAERYATLRDDLQERIENLAAFEITESEGVPETAAA